MTDVAIACGSHLFHATVSVPYAPRGMIAFAHGSGSSSASPRNTAVAAALQDVGFATLLVDLLTPSEAAAPADAAAMRFDVDRLASRFLDTLTWLEHSALATLPLGVFGASTGAAVALIAAAAKPQLVRAVVSRGGRPDLADGSLELVQSATLLLVGERDAAILQLNQEAAERLRCHKRLIAIDGATHLFEEGIALPRVAQLARAWFIEHMAPSRALADGERRA